ncbi:hypothetical protein FOMPIDRAFT_97639 [Fomitopsis schrenkii]|uniref:Uncharacterized protein n=1 Tax=Fomitopsis schrenkii TaxID=2126942 RepID=S8ELF1_FOMSC|nr:hypothetical protein FOMPIDRAFT_97639 [Fomitopsis schrenkii]
MASTIFSSQKVPGTPARAPPASEQSPGTNFLADFSFSRIGQEPTLLKRLSNAVSADQDQILLYPSSPSPSLPDAPAFGAVSREPTPSAARGPALTSTRQNSTPLRETSSALTAALTTGPNLPTSAATAAGSSTHLTPSVYATKQNIDTSYLSQSSQRDGTDATNPTLASARETSLPHRADAPTSFRPTSAGTSTQTRCQDTRRALVTQEPSPAGLVARISQVALEKAEWGEMKLLMEQYRREHHELLRRNDESARAYQKEREQASKVSAIADTAFSKFETLLLRQEGRLALDQQQAESALTEAQGVITDRKARLATELDEEDARATAEARRLQVEAEEKRRVAEASARRAAEETKRKAALEEEKRQVEAERERAKRELLETEKRRAEEERRKLTEERLKAEAAEEQRKAEIAEEERRRIYAAQRAAADQEKRAYLEAQRLEARQNQEKRPKLAKEEVKARLEKERKEAASRSTSVSSTGLLVPTKAGSEWEPTMSSSHPDAHTTAAPFDGSASFTLPAQPTLPSKSAAAQNPHIDETQTGKTRGRRNNHTNSLVVGQQAQLTVTSSVTPAEPVIWQTVEGPQMGNQIRPEVRTPQDGAKPETAAPRSSPAMPSQATSNTSTLQQVSAKEGQGLSTSRRPAQPSQATTSAQRAVKPSRSNLSAKAASAASPAQPVVKQESSIELEGLMARALPVPVSAAPNSADGATHGHAEKPRMGGSSQNMGSHHPVPPASASSNTMKDDALHRPATPVPPAKHVSVPVASSSLHQRTLAKASRNSGTLEVSGEADPWVNTPDAGEEDLHRRVDLREETCYPLLARDHYSPPRTVTPPPTRGYDHYSPATNYDHPTRRDERTQVRRKRMRPTADTWRMDNEPPARRARVSPPIDIPERRRVTAPEPRAQPMWPNADFWDERDGPSHDNGWGDHSSPHQATFSRPYSPPYFDDGPLSPYCGNGPLYDERQFRQAASVTAHGFASNPRPQSPSWHAEQSLPLQRRIAESDSHSSLLERISDNRKGASNATRGRGAAPSTGRGRGRGNGARGGGGKQNQQRTLQSRLTSGEDGLGSRLS